MIKLPEELKGQEAVPFLEWYVSESLRSDRLISKHEELEMSMFYYQPFSPEMLVNPYQKYQTTEGKCLLNSSDEWASYSNIVNPEWQQFEQNRLLDSWINPMRDEYLYVINNYILLTIWRDSTYKWCLRTDSSDNWFSFTTLNDLLTLIKNTKVKITWKNKNL